MQVMSSYTLIFVMMMFPVGESAFSLFQPYHWHLPLSSPDYPVISRNRRFPSRPCFRTSFFHGLLTQVFHDTPQLRDFVT